MRMKQAKTADMDRFLLRSKVLAKGRNYFTIGTRKYTKECSYTILITYREYVRIQTQLKRTNKYTGEENLSELEHEFPRIPNIEENQLLKKENNEWCLNDSLKLDENLRVNDLFRDWDHPGFCQARESYYALV